MQHDAADQLHVEMPLAEGALGRLAHRGEGLGQDVVQVLARFQAFTEPGRAGAKLVVAQGLQLGFQGIDGRDLGTEGFDVTVVGRAEQPPSDGTDHRETSKRFARFKSRRNPAAVRAKR